MKPYLQSAYVLLWLLLPCQTNWAQTTQNNPLIRPVPAHREAQGATLPPPGGPGKADGGSAQAKSLQEEVTANIQKLNADRVPMPLRVLLSTVYVSAISGKTAVLRQPVPPLQQVLLANQGNAPSNNLTGTGMGMGMGMGMGSGMGMSGMPGQIPGAQPGGITPGLPGMNPLSAAPGQSPLGQSLPRPTSIRVRDGQMFSLQGYDLLARVREQEVTLVWINSEDKETIVFQSLIESPSVPAYVPPAGVLEKPDTGYLQRVQSSSQGGSGGSTGSAGGAGTGGR
jgi:hypothetical protein